MLFNPLPHFKFSFVIPFQNNKMLIVNKLVCYTEKEKKSMKLSIILDPDLYEYIMYQICVLCYILKQLILKQTSCEHYGTGDDQRTCAHLN